MLDLGHTTTSFSANEMIQFAIGVELEVTLESYRLLEDVLLCARWIGSVGGRGQVRRSRFPSCIGPTVANSVPSQLKYSQPTVSGFTATALGVDTVRPSGIEEPMIAYLTQGTQPMGPVIGESGKELSLCCYGFLRRWKSRIKIHLTFHVKVTRI